MTIESESPLYRIRYEGKEYGPFTEKKLKAWLRERELTDDISRDAFLDPKTNEWKSLKELIAPQKEEEDVWKNVTIHNTYRKITIAGLYLILLWALVFVGIRIFSGRWPGEHLQNKINSTELNSTELNSTELNTAGDTVSLE